MVHELGVVLMTTNRYGTIPLPVGWVGPTDSENVANFLVAFFGEIDVALGRGAVIGAGQSLKR